MIAILFKNVFLLSVGNVLISGFFTILRHYDKNLPDWIVMMLAFSWIGYVGSKMVEELIKFKKP